MIPKITEEQRQALGLSAGIIEVHDEMTDKQYLLVAEDRLPTLWEEYIRREVSRGLECVDRGEIVDWNPERIMAEGRRLQSERFHR